MDLKIKGKIAFVTASSKGLGKAVAMQLAKEGAYLAICARQKQQLQLTAAEIGRFNDGNVLPLTGDLSNAEQREEMIDRVLEHYKKVDILITNTGGPPAGKFEDFDLNDWNTAYEQLLATPVVLIKKVLPGMKAQKWGRIIAITSQAVKQPVDNLILSNSIRASVVGLIKTLSNELGSYNITVNNVMPGYTKTSRLENLIKSNPSFAAAVDTIPLKRFAEPEEFAAAVAFLASERAGYITGTSLAVDGGWIKSML